MLDSPREIVSLAAAEGQEMRFGARAARIGGLLRHNLPVPDGVALSFDAVRALASGSSLVDLGLDTSGLSSFVSLRSSTGNPAWGRPTAILNIGVTEAALPELIARIGEAAALEVYARTIQSFGVRVGGIDPEAFEALSYDRAKLQGGLSVGTLRALVDDSLALFEDELEEPFPDTQQAQLEGAVKAMVRAWNAPSARILRRAKGAPEDAGLGLLLQDMVFGIGPHVSGSGTLQRVDSATGDPVVTGRFHADTQEAGGKFGFRSPSFASRAEREASGQTAPSLEEIEPERFAQLHGIAAALTGALRDEMAISFTLSGGDLSILDAEPVKRSARAAVRIAVDLAEAGVISRDTALLRIAPQSLVEILHAQIAPSMHRDLIANGLPASPGAATGRIVLSPDAALVAAAQDISTILVRSETTPDDTRGVQAAAGVLTVRGGMSSHAAVIARGLGRPCVVGARDLAIDRVAGQITLPSGRVLSEGDAIAIDGSTGEVMAGTPELIVPETSGPLGQLMDWADAVRNLGVRANADTVQDAEVARRFGAEGIGLCRTEHLFLEPENLSLMRQMILSDGEAERRVVLDLILPRHRADLRALFACAAGQPVTVRLLDPPLHEFLPHEPEEFEQLGEEMGLSVSELTKRAANLSEVNPMLGLRGVRLGVAMPEIYDMQIRAIIEAAIEAATDSGQPVTPEIMIPLVSANREAELVKTRIDALAATVHNETGAVPSYKIGVMVETPRSALCAGELARSSAFLSFGTNDLTQMVYGLSRDDAGRFMRAYVAGGVMKEDPFHTLDVEGVGELLRIAVERGCASNPDLTLGLCGEHGGDPDSIRFCEEVGIHYVSCSPYRVPIARLAAAHAALMQG